MALSPHERKILWARSGGFCAFCKGLLTEDSDAPEGPTVIGIEAHIVSDELGGPRYRPLPPGEVDRHTNRILVCPNHHTVIDHQVSRFPEAKLRQVKADHESWVRERVVTLPEIRIRDPIAGEPVLVHRIATGRQLMGLLAGSDEFGRVHPEPRTAEEAELLGDFLGMTLDSGEIWGELDQATQVRTEFDLTAEIARVANRGFTVYAGVRYKVLEGGSSPGTRWRSVLVAIYRADDPEVASQA
jgi:hypothetical protein